MLLDKLYKVEHEFWWIDIVFGLLISFAAPEVLHQLEVLLFHFQVAFHPHAPVIVLIDDDIVAFSQSAGLSSSWQWANEGLHSPVTVLFWADSEPNVPLPVHQRKGGSSLNER